MAEILFWPQINNNITCGNSESDFLLEFNTDMISITTIYKVTSNLWQENYFPATRWHHSTDKRQTLKDVFVSSYLLMDMR